jgi:adenine-specific DNA methylase
MLKFPPDERCPQCGGLYALIGHRHLCRGATATNLVTLPVTVETTTPVTATVTCARCVFLESEVKRLKRELAEGGMKRVGMSGAERTRRYRERRRATGPVGP